MSQPERIVILFVHYGDEWLRGSEIVLLDLLARLDPARVQPLLWCNAEPVATAAAALGCPVHRADFAGYVARPPGPAKARRFLALVRQGLDIVRTRHVRVLHANSAAPTQWLVPVARCARLPLLAHVHAPYARRERFTSLLHQATAVAGVSRHVLRDLLEDGYPAHRAQVIANGIDPARLLAPPGAGADLRRSLQLPDNSVLIISVASLQPRKGLDLLLEAVASVTGLPNLHIALVGDGPERSALARMAERLGIAHRVHFLGTRAGPALGAAYQAADLMVLASRQEAFGLVLAEAGSFALPVVATAVGGIPEVVRHGETGLLVSPESVASLADAIARLAADPGQRARLGQAARSHVMSAFTADRMALAFAAAYQRLAHIPCVQLGWRASLPLCRPYLALLRRPARGTVGAEPAHVPTVHRLPS